MQLHYPIASCNCICKNYVKQKQVNKSLTNECNFLSFIINDLRLNDKNNCKNVWLFEIFVVTLPLSIETITAVMRVFKIKY